MSESGGMNKYEQLYSIISKCNVLTMAKGWTFMLYYPLMKEIDSLHRHFHLFHSIYEYSLDSIDSFYYSFNLYDPTLPAISVDEFEQILNNTDIFFPCPLKSYSASYNKPLDSIFLTNYHDASPCFYYGRNSFRVEINKDNLFLSQNEMNKVFSYIMQKVSEANLVQKEVMPIFKTTLNNYIIQAANAFPTIWGWLELVAKSKINTIITDQTLAPNQCFVLHVLKESGCNIIVLQHQRNLLLSDIFPLLYLDFHLSDTYYTWYSKEEIVDNYAYKYDLPYDKIMQSSNLTRPHVTEQMMIRILESSKSCLLVTNAPALKSIDGTTLDSLSYYDYIRNIIVFLDLLGFDVFLRKDPRDTMLKDDVSVQFDKNKTLKDAIIHYDICICDRPGGATVEAMENKGFALVCSSKFKDKLTQTYYEYMGLQRKIIKRVSPRIKRLLDSFDLLCYNSDSY